MGTTALKSGYFLSNFKVAVNINKCRKKIKLLISMHNTCVNRSIKPRDLDPHWLYKDSDPQNLMDADPDPGQWEHQIDFKSSFKSRRKMDLYYVVSAMAKSLLICIKKWTCFLYKPGIYVKFANIHFQEQTLLLKKKFSAIQIFPCIANFIGMLRLFLK